MENRTITVPSSFSKKIALRVIPGHFATTHSHINCYIDISKLKVNQDEAKECAARMATKYSMTTQIDTIVCMDGMEVMGAYLADALTQNGYRSVNANSSLSIISPEIDFNRQMIFRDNVQSAVYGKNILILLASATTGKTIRRCIECVTYYGGKVTAISAIFSNLEEIDGYKIDRLFSADDIPGGYQAYEPSECPFCKRNQRLDALVNSFGYSRL
ncbi:MAG: orotate phosphoribosyltransferase [Firmicutes bacterium]|nr:orotate phosphoribosyltransferase [Bacillota bacterium]